MISTKNLEQAKNAIKKSAEKPIIIEAQDNAFNRKILEYGKFNILLLSNFQGKDSLKSLDSGLNHVLAKLAAKNKVAIGINLQKLQNLDKKQKAIQLSRIRQNLKICRKAKCEIKLINAKDSKDAQALLMSLGASTQQIK